MTLTDEIRTFIVNGLACFDSPSEVAAAVKETFGVACSRQLVHAYDPTGSQPPALRWRELHAATRRAYLHDMAEVGIAHKAVRLRLLDRMAHSALEYRQFGRVAALLEQAAKECGGLYERRPPRAP